MVCRYFYGNVELLFAIKSGQDIDISDTPNVYITYDEKQYGFNSLWLRNRVLSIRPIDSSVRQLFSGYFSDEGLLIPDFLLLKNED